MSAIDHTHAADAQSWVESARRSDTDFPLQNLPFGVFHGRARFDTPRVGVAIGDEVLDLSRAVADGHFDGLGRDVHSALVAGSLNPLMALGRPASQAVRRRAFELLRGPRPAVRDVSTCLVGMDSIELLLPADIGDYTDFYASVHHATNVGTMLRPDNPLFPNYKYIPIGYHGRSSTIVVSGTEVRRPTGQTKGDSAPVFGPTRSMDYECEVGVFVGTGNPLGSAIPIEDSEAHLFGVCLLNDWSARDVQAWEYQPLGPFLAKNFATSISPWVVTLEALAPFRVAAAERPSGDPAPLAYLDSEGNRREGGIAIRVEALLSTREMRNRGLGPVRLSSANFATMYWTLAQLVTHHASNGCRLRPGDLIGSGTISGPAKENRGCLLELTWRGTEPLQLPSGEARRFLEDGDEVVLRGFCEREGYVRIGLGECRGTVVAAQSAPETSSAAE